MAPSNRKITVVFGVRKYRTLSAFRNQAIKVSADIAAYPLIFVTPNPTVASVNTHLDTMDAAQVLVDTGGVNAVATRNAARNIVMEDMHAWERYVQGLIAAETDFDQKMVIAVSSGLDIRVNGVRVKKDLELTQLITPGMMKMVARAAGPKAAYEWQMSQNNGTSWTTLPVTNVAKTTVSGLTAGLRYLFRFRSTVKNVTSGWSTSESFIYTINP